MSTYVPSLRAAKWATAVQELAKFEESKLYGANDILETIRMNWYQLRVMYTHSIRLYAENYPLTMALYAAAMERHPEIANAAMPSEEALKHMTLDLHAQLVMMISNIRFLGEAPLQGAAEG